MPRIQVIIPNWNGRHLLAKCLNALSKQTFKDFSITIVDNGSTDDSLTWLQEHYPTVQIIANRKNRGFAPAINQGIAASDGQYIATLNNDAWPDPTWLEELLSPMSTYERVGMCASKMLFADRPNMINSTGINLDWTGIAWDRRGGEIDKDEDITPQEIFGACAGAALYRRELLVELQGFEENFFAYLEDVDLAWRARLMGWRAFYVPTAIVHHHHSATAGEGSPFKNFLLGRNKVWLIVKNYPLPYLLKYLPVIILYDLGTLPYTLVVRGELSAIRGRWAALKNLNVILPKRRLVQSQIRDLDNWARFMQPVVPPWRVSQRYRHLRSRIKQDSIS